MSVTAPPLSPPRPSAPSGSRGPRRAGRLVLGAVLLAGGAALAVGGVALHDLDTSEREGGYLTSDGVRATTSGYALATDTIHVDGFPDNATFGDTRLEVTPDDPDDVLFVGLAAPDDAADFLRGVDHSVVTDITRAPDLSYSHHAGDAPLMDPTHSDIWIDSSTGVGPQSVVFPHHDKWTVVVVDADLGSDLDVSARFQAEVPYLQPLMWALWSAALACSVAGVLVIRRGVGRRRARG